MAGPARAATDPTPVVAALLLRGGRLLVTRRSAADPLGAVWEFPGGKVEPGESLAEALRRELKEELGIDARVGNLVEAIRHDYPQRSVELFFLRCFLVEGEPAGQDGQDLLWALPEELAAMPFPAADARLITRLPQLAALWVKEESRRDLTGC